MALLEVTDLVVHYGKALALERVSLSVERGQLVGVLGPNGAGKTTLLKAISRSVAPSAGHVVFDGRSLDGLPAHKVVGRGICHCPEGRRLFPELSVFKNLMLGAYLRNDKVQVARDLDKVYALFPILKERSRQQASTLSGGQQQMLAIARALMGGPDAASARRAFSRYRSSPQGRDLPGDPCDPGGRHGGSPGRAGCPHNDGGRQTHLRPRAWPFCA